MSRYVMGNYGRFPLTLTRGEGSWIWDEAGKKYLDFATGIAVCSLGHCHPAIREALREQAGKLIHCSNLFQIREQAELAEFIVERVVRQSGRIFFCNSGAEANDALIKLARKFGHDSAASHGSARYEMVTCTNSFHGRTLGGIAATGQDKVKKGFEPLLEGFTHVPFNDCDALRAAVGPQTAAILFEVVQGEGGIHVATPEFLQTARELRDEFGLLVMLDEVQCGFGRTGDWNAWETVLRDVDGEFSPDAVSWAKGMGGGFPIGGIWASDRLAPGADFRVCDVLGPGTHGSTFGGTPLASAVGMAVLKTIEEDGLIDNARSLGEQIRTAVSSWNHPLIADIRGLGLLIGFVIDETALSDCVAFGESGQTPSLFVVNQLMKDADLLTVPAGANVVRWLPPLNVTEEEVEEALRRMRHTLDQLLKR